MSLLTANTIVVMLNAMGIAINSILFIIMILILTYVFFGLRRRRCRTKDLMAITTIGLLIVAQTNIFLHFDTFFQESYMLMVWLTGLLFVATILLSYYPIHQLKLIIKHHFNSKQSTKKSS